MSEYLLLDEAKFKKNAKLEDILINLDDSDIGYFFEVDLKQPNEIKKSKEVPICS